MYIKHLHINAFGPLCDADLSFDRGLNVIEGENESGKSSVAMFIKFIFYGLSARTGDSLSERQLYVNWSRGVAAGYAVCVIEEDGAEREIRIERSISSRTDAEGKLRYTERVKVLDHETSMPIQIKGQPGEFFFGVPEQVFTSSAFASQGGDVRPDSAAVREAVENIILAADENVSVKRAVDAIEKARIKLLHKNHTGGEIYDLEQKRDALEAKLMETKDSSARLIKAEVSLADVKENINAAKKKVATLEKVAEALTVMDTSADYEVLARHEASLADVRNKISTMNAGGTEESFRSSLALAIRDLDKADKLKNDLALKEESLKENFPDGEICDPEEDLEFAEKMHRRGKGALIPALILLAVGGIALVISFLMRGKLGAYLPVFAGSAALVMAGLVTLILAFAWKRDARDVCEDWGVENMEDLRETLAEAGKMYLDIEKQRTSISAAEKDAEDAKTTLDLLAAAAGIDNTKMSPKDTAKHLAIYSNDCIKKKRELEAEAARVEGLISAAKASLGADSKEDITSKMASLLETEAGKTAASMTPDERRGLSRELQFNRMKLENLRGRELDLERETSSLRAVAVSPSAAAEQIESINSEITKLTKEHDAYVLASAAIKAASENIRLSVVPRLTDSASRIMARVTDGRYRDIGVSSSFDMNFRNDEFGTLELDFLSAGTREIAYIALRLALVKALFGEKSTPPMIFDESLASLDERRVRAAVEALAEGDTQVFLFSCRTLEASLLRGTKTTMPKRK